MSKDTVSAVLFKTVWGFFSAMEEGDEGLADLFEDEVYKILGPIPALTEVSVDRERQVVFAGDKHRPQIVEIGHSGAKEYSFRILDAAALDSAGGERIVSYLSQPRPDTYAEIWESVTVD